MALSKDPEARARQMANLRPENLRPDAALKHGTRSDAIVGELTSGYERELEETFPGEPAVWRRIQATRMAKIALLSDYLARRPSLVLNLRTGKLNPAAAEQESLSRALLADLEKAEGRKGGRAARNGAAGLAALRERGAAITDGRVSDVA